MPIRIEPHVPRCFSAFLAAMLVIFTLASCTPADRPTLLIEDSWGIASPSIPGAGSLFLVITNTGKAPDKLLSAKSDACGMVEIHETVKKVDGTMGMNLVSEPVVIPAGGQVVLKPGSLHIMCLKMDTSKYTIGDQISLTLMFEKSGEKTVAAEIRGNP